MRSLVAEVPALARRPPPSDRGVRVRPHRPQGGRRRQRRHPRLDPPVRRPRRPGSAVPAVEGGRGVGARAVRRQERARPPRPAGGRRAAADAGGERHLPRLAARQGPRRPDARLLRAPVPRLEGERRGREPPRAGDDRPTRGLCGATLARAHARWGDRIAIASYLGAGDAFDVRSRTSPPPTPTRTSATTRRSSRRSRSGRLTAHAGL